MAKNVGLYFNVNGPESYTLDLLNGTFTLKNLNPVYERSIDFTKTLSFFETGGSSVYQNGVSITEGTIEFMGVISSVNNSQLVLSIGVDVDENAKYLAFTVTGGSPQAELHISSNYGKASTFGSNNLVVPLVEGLDVSKLTAEDIAALSH